MFFKEVLSVLAIIHLCLSIPAPDPDPDPGVNIDVSQVVQGGGCCPGSCCPIEESECPVKEGFFWHAASSQCFKFLEEEPSLWHDAKKKCHDHGLILARPYETIQLRNYIVLRYGNGPDGNNGDENHRAQVWLDAAANGTCVEWLHGHPGCIPGPEFSPYWFKWPVGDYGYTNQTGYCMLLTSNADNIKDDPVGTLYMDRCDGYHLWPLCELIL